jgi:hypothetical protein
VPSEWQQIGRKHVSRQITFAVIGLAAGIVAFLLYRVTDYKPSREQWMAAHPGQQPYPGFAASRPTGTARTPGTPPGFADESGDNARFQFVPAAPGQPTAPGLREPGLDACKANLTAIFQAEEAYRVRNRSYTANLADLTGLIGALPRCPSWKQADSAYAVTVDGNTLRIACDEAGAHVPGKRLVYDTNAARSTFAGTQQDRAAAPVQRHHGTAR